MSELSLYSKYSRKEVHDHFVPGGSFTPNAGTWGLHGCVLIPETPSDYVFFVTYGQSQGDHIFQEGISEAGIITWQSQPRQHLAEKRIRQWIDQVERGDNIYLFVRSKKGDPYVYFGKIQYKSHDPFKEYPVWFEFQLLNWPPSEDIIGEFVRKPTSDFIQSGGASSKRSLSEKSTRKKVQFELNPYEEHVRDLIISNQHLIDAGDGYRWESNYEFDLGDVADLIFFGPGREAKILAISTAENEVSYLKALQAKLWRSQLCFEKEEDENSEFIQVYLVASKVSEHTKDFCQKYDVRLLLV